jgi:hypothetical protein
MVTGVEITVIVFVPPDADKESAIVTVSYRRC